MIAEKSVGDIHDRYLPTVDSAEFTSACEEGNLYVFSIRMVSWHKEYVSPIPPTATQMLPSTPDLPWKLG